jgi:hypothetical protein
MKISNLAPHYIRDDSVLQGVEGLSYGTDMAVPAEIATARD